MKKKKAPGRGAVLSVKQNGQFSYNIILESSFDRLIACLKEMGTQTKRVCIVTDNTVGELYDEKVRSLLQTCCREVTVFMFPAGEAHKNLDTIAEIYRHLIERHFDRRDILVALGGGVVGDMTGYAAATYLRGISFIQIPTTLLSQVDSSIGGKTGVDFEQYKNMVGAFHQPSLVYINLSVLDTLTAGQFACGMGEVLKHGLIRDSAYYEWLIDHMSEIEERDPATLQSMIKRSCEIKREVVEKDPTEKGERALLNFGHTLGHAIEKLKGFSLLHGQCVALGCVAAAYISWQKGYLSEEEFYEIRDMNVGFDLPISVDGITAEDVVATTKLDKKMAAGQIRFVLLRGIGHAFIDTTVTDEEMKEAADYIIFKG